MTFTFVLPFKLLSKPNSYRAAKGRVYKPKAILDQESDIKRIALISLPSHACVASLKEWHVEINIYVDNRRRFDIDNTAKILLDCLNGIAWKDDSQVTSLIIRKFLGSATTETVVVLTEL